MLIVGEQRMIEQLARCAADEPLRDGARALESSGGLNMEPTAWIVDRKIGRPDRHLHGVSGAHERFVQVQLPPSCDPGLAVLQQSSVVGGSGHASRA